MVVSNFCCLTSLATGIIFLWVILPILFLDAEPGIARLYHRAFPSSTSNISKNTVETHTHDDNNNNEPKFIFHRALSSSPSANDVKHPIFTVINDNNSLHSHENLTEDGNDSGISSKAIDSKDEDKSTTTPDKNSTMPSNNTKRLNETATKEQNATVSNIMMTPVTTSTPGSSTPKIDIIADIHDASAALVKDWGLGWDTKISRIAQVLLGLLIYYVIMIIKGFIISWGITEVSKAITNFGRQDENKMDILANLVSAAVNNLATKFGS